MNTAPIALFVYNRPRHVRETVLALQKNKLAAESDLFIFSDGPKHPDSETAVRGVRDFIKSVGGFRTVNIVERDRNWGLAKSIIDGVTRLCKEHGRVVVLEDDLLVSSHFLEYMNVALNKYADDSRVMQVSGHMFPVELNSDSDAFFLPITTTWGWATWDRAWKRFDSEMHGYHDLLNDPALRLRFDFDCGYPCFEMLESVRAGKIDAWGIRWYLSVFMNNGLVLFPAKSLVENKGFGEDGTNCKSSEGGARLSQPTSQFRVGKFPEAVQASAEEFDRVRKYLVAAVMKEGIFQRVFKRLLRAIGR